MLLPILFMGTLALVCLGIALYRGQGEHVEGAKTGGKMLIQVIPLLLCAFFIATDSTCSPANQRPMWLYGFGVGFLIVLVRAFGVWPDAVPFAILLMNSIHPLLDRIRPRVGQESA